jgi:DNA (cytosine-5)-methyltransferase 1
MIRFGSLFSGIEAASLAWQPLGWSCAWVAEIDPFASALLAARYPGVPNLGDVTRIDPDAVEPVDLVVFGSPCQDFSIAGRRRGMDGERGNLSLVALALVAKLRPRWVVFENVPGLLSNWSGEAPGDLADGEEREDEQYSDFAAFLGAVRECGYLGCWRVYDAQFAGVPQRRRRVFFVGYLGDWRPAAAVLFEPESLRGDSAPRREAGQGVARPVTGSPPGGSGYRNDADTADSLIVFDTTQITNPLDRSSGVPGRPSHTLAKGSHPPAIAFQEPITFDPTARQPEWSVNRPLKTDGPLAVAYGGNNRSGPIDIAAAVNAHGGPHGRLDFESETFVGVANAGRTDRVHPRISDVCAAGALGSANGAEVGQQAEITHSLRADGFDAGEDRTGRGTPLVYGIGSDAVDRSGEGASGAAGDRSGLNIVEGTQPSLRARPNNSVATAMSVRRLTPRECERLQGLPDDYTLIPYRGKPAADGPRYRAIGNSMAVPVMRWIGERIRAFEQLETAE